VGKSFIANLILGKQSFQHKISATSVTNTIEFDTIPNLSIDDFKQTLIYNIPGLIEAKSSNMERNKSMLNDVLRTNPNVVLMFIFTNQNGRLVPDDIEAFRALIRSYPTIDTESLVIVFNQAKTHVNGWLNEMLWLLKKMTPEWKQEFTRVVCVDNLTTAADVNGVNQTRLTDTLKTCIPVNVGNPVTPLSFSSDEITKLREQLKLLQTEYTKQATAIASKTVINS
jgi:GTPase involved in cell partitioning and DNA repair